LDRPLGKGWVGNMDLFEASQLITDKYTVKILVGTTKKPKSAIELSEKFGIPIAACYRKIRELEKVGLLRCVERRLTRKGKRVSMYISQLKTAYLFFENGKLRMRFHLTNGVINDFGGELSGVDMIER
jgi:predicted transcriptional regulator